MIPIFIFSLPRSGSTLLQRILSAEGEIATVSEPWILLPLLSTLRENGVFTDYRHRIAVKGIEDFYNRMPDGRTSYLTEMRAFVSKLYEHAAGDEVTHFLDKTPRYHLVISEIFELFPDGKFIFLWRNPLAVIASMLKLFNTGNWELYRFQIDLFDGLSNMIAAAQHYSDRICCVCYEELVTQPEQEVGRLFSFLQKSWDARVIANFANVELGGRLGDPVGSKQYHSLSTKSLEKWKQVLSNPLRKAWCRRYLRWLGQERLQIMGYELEQLLEELDGTSLTFRYLERDLFFMAYSPLYRFFEPHIMRSKFAKLANRQSIYAHL